MMGIADALHDLGDPVSDRVLVLNVLRSLSSIYDHLKTWITCQKPFPSFLQVRDDLALEEITRGLAHGLSSPTLTALVAAPPPLLPPRSLVLLPPGRPEVGGMDVGGGGTGWWWYWWPCS